MRKPPGGGADCTGVGAGARTILDVTVPDELLEPDEPPEPDELLDPDEPPEPDDEVPGDDEVAVDAALSPTIATAVKAAASARPTNKPVGSTHMIGLCIAYTNRLLLCIIAAVPLCMLWMPHQGSACVNRPVRGLKCLARR